ncbi:sugar hydrolase [Actinoplanes sp. SE50]|uniref:glycoside hydrolase family 3 protein n=1 Tax=unclassified Actinoplanes TaxID=2626549 RepID=UPI00023EBE14|nr:MULTISPECIES: glycoside hydrolase family 3 protein [unclassified Actinoplanes]AEV87451.1 beta-N-acetylhexosaminidase [Actinoplanes sp. SE50/110]ATO85853.1 sugar hydrolase [Actinoplanes sp. SE50]SLM03267.1 sugar hydrolase [Actinoplanes sp. SE50/110]
MSKHGDLPELAAAVLQPGFVGTSAPDWVRRWLAGGLGGVALFARNVESPAQIAALTAQLRAENPDVIVAIDEEAGDVTRFESRLGSSRPGNLALGAIDDPRLTEAVARDLSCHLAAAGITLDYAPDADVNSNPGNPVIGVRAFGAEPLLVARHTAAFVRGLQTYGVAACAKHFPGHGDTSVDSHHDVPLIERTAEQLEACELVPFRAAIAAGARVVMTGHLLVPAYDTDLPATLSPRILTGLLREELGFDGLIVTDGIEMQGVRRRFGLAGATVRALAAGVDAICVGGDHADEQTAILLRDAIVAAVRSGELPEERLRDAVARVRALGAWTTRTQQEAGVVRGPQPESEIGYTAARRAVRVTRTAHAPELPVIGVPHVVEFAPPRNIAIGEETPWGIGAPLTDLLPGTTSIRLGAEDLNGLCDPASRVLDGAAGRPLVLVVRDVHRHRWIEDTLAGVLAVRPDAIVVEMGIPVTVVGGVHVATFGATRACGLAAAELIAGAVVPEPIAA